MITVNKITDSKHVVWATRQIGKIKLVWFLEIEIIEVVKINSDLQPYLQQ